MDGFLLLLIALVWVENILLFKKKIYEPLVKCTPVELIRVALLVLPIIVAMIYIF